jgi:hypothetical protein
MMGLQGISLVFSFASTGVTMPFALTELPVLLSFVSTGMMIPMIDDGCHKSSAFSPFHSLSQEAQAKRSGLASLHCILDR